MIMVNPVGGGAVLVTTMENVCDCLAPALSATVAVNENVPVAAGVPLMLPVACSDNPDDEIGPTGDQLYEGVPPVAVSAV